MGSKLVSLHILTTCSYAYIQFGGWATKYIAEYWQKPRVIIEIEKLNKALSAIRYAIKSRNATGWLGEITFSLFCYLKIYDRTEISTWASVILLHNSHTFVTML